MTRLCRCSTSNPRIGQGGGNRPSGAMYSLGTRIVYFIARNSSADMTKPISGLNNSALNTPIACPQSTPDVAEPSGTSS